MARKNPAAVSLGRRGGKVRSDAKAEAARANGAKGGRPRRPPKRFRGTWLGRPGVSVEHRFDSQPTGKRVIVHTWDDSDSVEVRAVRGDFWKKPALAIEFEKLTLKAPTAEQIDAAVDSLAAKHFTKPKN